MKFTFGNQYGHCSGHMAFLLPSSFPGSARPQLVVTDHGHNAVHLVDVEGRTHAGVPCAPWVHRRAPGRGGEWDLSPGGRQRVEDG